MSTTILIPARIISPQGLDYFHQSLQSAVSQKRRVLVALNNCSVPFSVRELREKYPDIEFFEMAAGSLSEVRNFLVEKVETKYFFFLDADDLLPAGVIEKAEKLHPGKGYIYGHTVLFTDTSNFMYKARPFDCFELTKHVYFPNGVLNLTENYKIVGPWDKQLKVLEDKEWWIRAAQLDVCGTPVDLEMYKYRQNAEGMVAKAKNTEKWLFANRYIKAKHQTFYSGGPDMACACNSGKKKGFKKTAGSPKAPSPGPLSPTEGETMLRYTMGTGMVSYYGIVSGRRYQVSAMKRQVNVDNRDLETGNKSRPGLLELKRNGKPVFERAVV